MFRLMRAIFRLTNTVQVRLRKYNCQLDIYIEISCMNQLYFLRLTCTVFVSLKMALMSRNM